MRRGNGENDARHNAAATDLGTRLVDVWARQGRDGFLLADPDSANLEVHECSDPRSGVNFRFLWMPHRELRGDVKALEQRGILNPQRNEQKLFRDPRDPHGRHCFLCASNVRECNPMEELVPLELDQQHHFAGANFAWIERDHFTVMSADHLDQVYSRHVLEAMIDLHHQAGGRFRVLFNGTGAGATIPWHRHYQITTEPMPIEQLADGQEAEYPTAVQRFTSANGGSDAAHEAVVAWLNADDLNHTLNLMIAGSIDDPRIHFFPRDQRHAKADNKGLVGGFEVSGDFVMSAPAERAGFDNARAETARGILEQIRPPTTRT